MLRVISGSKISIAPEKHTRVIIIPKGTESHRWILRNIFIRYYFAVSINPKPVISEAPSTTTPLLAMAVAGFILYIVG